MLTREKTVEARENAEDNWRGIAAKEALGRQKSRGTRKKVGVFSRVGAPHCYQH